MKKRRKRLINRYFQFRTAFKVMAIVLISYVIFISVMGSFTWVKQTQISETTSSLRRAVSVEDNIIRAFIDYSQKNMFNDSEEILAMKKIKTDHKESMDTMTAHMDMLLNYSRDFFYLFIIISIVVLLMSIGVFFYLLRLTQRISGPLYVMEQQIETILQGDEPEVRELRKDDEFREFYGKFIDLAKVIKERQDKK